MGPGTPGGGRPVRDPFRRRAVAADPRGLQTGRRSQNGCRTGGTFSSMPTREGKPRDGDVWVTSLDEDGTPAVRTGLQAMLMKQKLTNWIGLAVDRTRLRRRVLAPFGSIRGRCEYLEGPRLTPDLSGRRPRRAVDLRHGQSDICSCRADRRGRPAHGVCQGCGPMRDVWRSAVGRGSRSGERTAPAAHRSGERGGLTRPSPRTGGSWSIGRTGVALVNVWARDLVSGKETRVSTTPSGYASCISRDGSRIVYGAGRPERVHGRRGRSGARLQRLLGAQPP